MDDDVKHLLEAIRHENAAAHVGTRRHFDVVAEALRHDIGIVAEGVVANTERVERLSSEMKEDTVAELQARIERIESSTH